MVTTVTTIMVIALVGFIGYSVWNRNTISFWGHRNLFLLMYGFVICCFAAARDGLDKTIQAAVAESCGYGACKNLYRSLHLFAQNGYETVSVSRIAGELGMTKGALYRHYQNKREIRSDRQENGTEGQ